MSNEIIKFFSLQRQIFGVCPKSGKIFRLSDCRVYRKEKPVKTWYDQMTGKEDVLAAKEARFEEQKQAIKERAREKGRASADRAVARIDTVFKPKRLNPDDSKVIFHPVDFTVFHGLSDHGVSKVVFLDREDKEKDMKKVQKSIEKTVEKRNYEWQTLRVGDDGKIKNK